MKILGIETSCDETAVCVIDGTGTIADFSYTLLGNALYSQVALHKEYGGVFPSLAKREHAKNLTPLLVAALRDAGLLTPTEAPSILKERLTELKELLSREPELFAQLTLFFAQYKKPAVDAIAVTHGPGLEPALWVGVNFARALSLAWGIPLVPVNHMEGHIVISAMRGTTLAHLPLPALALLISGGHTEMVLMREWFTYQRIGETRDDAVGEAFDKVARLLGLPYPGGPEISRLAAHAREVDTRAPFVLTRPMLQSSDLDFSFSGVKTAVRNEVEKLGALTDELRAAVAREFEDTVTDVFERKVRTAFDAYGPQTLIIGGGVAANTYIRNRLEQLCTEYSVTFLACPPIQATDNALMIALAGYFRAQRGEYGDPKTLSADGNLRL